MRRALVEDDALRRLRRIGVAAVDVERLEAAEADMTQREHVRVELADRLAKSDCALMASALPNVSAKPCEKYGIEVVPERAVLQDLAHLLRLDLARTPGCIEH